MRRLLPLLALAVIVSGCATSQAMREPRSILQSGLVEDPKEAGRLEKKLTDKDIAALLDADIRAKVPTNLAIAGISEWCGWNYYEQRCGVIVPGAEELLRWKTLVEGVPHIGDVMPVTALSTGVRHPKVYDLRTAAANMGCELLLVYYVTDCALDNYTDAAALYWTFVGLWVAPGNMYEHRTVIQSIVVDCRTGVILGTATGDGHLKAACPAAYGKLQQDKLAEGARKKAMDDLLKGCKPLLKAIVSKAEQPRRG